MSRSPSRRLAVLAAVSLAVALASDRAAAQAWSKVQVSGSPPPFRCYGASLNRDPNTGRLILFGGNGCAGSTRNDAWYLDYGVGCGTPAWVPLPSAPVGLASHSAVYDPVANRLIVVGGCMGGCLPTSTTVWILEAANGLGSPAWHPLTTTGGPPAGRQSHRAVYDASTDRMTVFGGHDGGGSLATVMEEVWVLSGSRGGLGTWTLLTPTGAPATGTIGYYTSTVAYDAVTNRLVAFGGTPRNGTASVNSVWVLQNANGLGTPAWSNPLGNNPAGTPGGRAGGAAILDPSSNVMTYVQWNTSFETWAIPNANGVAGSVSIAPFPTGIGAPYSPHAAAAVHVPARNQLVAFTNAPGGTTNELWALGGVDRRASPAATLISTDATVGAACDAYGLGGQRLQSGVDNGDGCGVGGNGTLEPGEVDQTSYVCNGREGPATLVVSSSLAPGDGGCPTGGVLVQAGVDDGAGGGTPADGTLQGGEVDTTATVCNGAAGTDGAAGSIGANALATTTIVPPGDDHCADGGVQLDSGTDSGAGGGTAGDGALQAGEISSTAYVCNGAPGSDGASGMSTLVATTTLAPGQDSSCPAGGLRVQTGVDDGANGGVAANGQLEAGEVAATSFVCNGASGTAGADGANGYDALVATAVLAAGDTNCPAGGIRIDTGLDDGTAGGAARDGVLQPGEVDETSYVCHGVTGAAGAAGAKGGGCSTAGGGAPLVALALAFALRRRNRSRS